LLFVLTACATNPPPATNPLPAAVEAPPQPAAAARVPEITVEPLAPSPPPASPVQPAPALKQTAAIAPPPKSAPIDDNPKQLYGLSGQRVAALLGPANFVRRDGVAEIWQYRARECVLDVFLYRQDATLSVAHFELRQRSTSTEVPRRCFAGLLARQR
jgi:hypothetical protein